MTRPLLTPLDGHPQKSLGFHPLSHPQAYERAIEIASNTTPPFLIVIKDRCESSADGATVRAEHRALFQLLEKIHSWHEI